MKRSAPSGQKKHPWQVYRRPPPTFLSQAGNAVARAVLALFPWEKSTYPGRLKCLADLFHNRAASETIRDWRRGKHQPPQWAIERLRAAIADARQKLNDAEADLAKEKGR